MDKILATGSKTSSLGLAIRFIEGIESKMILVSISNALQILIGIGVALITNEHMEP